MAWTLRVEEDEIILSLGCALPFSPVFNSLFHAVVDGTMTEGVPLPNVDSVGYSLGHQFHFGNPGSLLCEGKEAAGWATLVRLELTKWRSRKVKMLRGDKGSEIKGGG